MLRCRAIDPHDCTLIEFAYARTGSMLKAARVVAFVMAWDAVRRDLGRSPSVDEYADWWREPRSTAYRHRDEFRDVFGLETPDPVLDVIAGDTSARHDLQAVAA